MANPNAIVSRTVRVVPARVGDDERAYAARDYVGVEVDDGRLLRLDPASPRSEGLARVLAGLAELRHPVYLEVEEDSATVSRLLVPEVGPVDNVREVEGGLEVLLERSHARHTLDRDRPDYEELERTLREAVARKVPVILTPDDAGGVVDLRFFEPGPDGGPIRHPPLERLSWLQGFFLWPWWPWRWRYHGCISPGRAQEVFDAMSATSCNPLAVPAPCIPFLFPDNGCWARAHEMARLMIDMGHVPRKVWIDGSLHTPTRNNPNCFVNWGWHVAPTLCVRGRGWFYWWKGTRVVIDPSMFTTPVAVATWKGAQGDPNAVLTYTDWTDYLWGQTDPDFTETLQDLAIYRVALQNRSIGPHGPPPYANCP